jgi:hypothetical protein
MDAQPHPAGARDMSPPAPGVVGLTRLTPCWMKANRRVLPFTSGKRLTRPDLFSGRTAQLEDAHMSSMSLVFARLARS